MSNSKCRCKFDILTAWTRKYHHRPLRRFSNLKSQKQPDRHQTELVIFAFLTLFALLRPTDRPTEIEQNDGNLRKGNQVPIACSVSGFFTFWFVLKGKNVWFDPGCGYYIPGEIAEENRPHKSLLIQSSYSGKVSSRRVCGCWA